MKNENDNFVTLFWINQNNKQFSSILPLDKAVKMKEILEIKVKKSWIE
jgi:hypothetical protein